MRVGGDQLSKRDCVLGVQESRIIPPQITIEPELATAAAVEDRLSSKVLSVQVGDEKMLKDCGCTSSHAIRSKNGARVD